MIMKKLTVAALGLAALIAGSAAAPAMARDRDNFSFGIVVGDPGYHRGDWEREHWRHERWERERAEREWRHRQWERERWERAHDYRWHRWHDGW